MFEETSLNGQASKEQNPLARLQNPLALGFGHDILCTLVVSVFSISTGNSD